MEVQVPPLVHPPLSYPLQDPGKEGWEENQTLCHPHTCFLLDRKGGSLQLFETETLDMPWCDGKGYYTDLLKAVNGEKEKGSCLYPTELLPQ